MPAPGIASRPGALLELARQASVSPNSVALIEPAGTKLTFAGLQDRIAAVAHRLTAAGIERQDSVALVLPDGADLIVGFLGIASVAGCAILNPALRGSEIQSTLADLEARAVIVDSSLDSPAAEVAQKLRMLVFDIESCRESRAGDRLPETLDTSDVALMLHTSATTGKARIAPLTHSNLAAMAANTRRILSLTSADRFLSMMPLFHLQGLLSSLAQLLAGGSVICSAGFDPATFLSWLEEYHPTWYTAGPTLHHAILPLVESHPAALRRSPLRFVRSIGAPMSQALMEQLERALHAPVLEGYGMTEAGAITGNTPDWRKPGSAGRSTGSEIGILSESGQFLPVGREGEIVVRGAAVMQSYRGNPEANRTAFHEGWLRTGDLGRLDADGFLFVTGRIKEIINRGGEKILPGEIEDSLTAHHAVEEAVAFGVPHPTLGEDVMAVVVLKPGAAATESELRRFASARIADVKLPRRIFFESVIPKGATGKPVRSDLGALFKPKLNSVSVGTFAATEVEKRLAGIWQKILKLENIDIESDFFQLGGDSLAFTLMMTEIESEFGLEDQAEFVSNPTIETLARIVESSPRQPREKSPCVALWPRGYRIPFFCIPGADENPYYFLDLAKRLGEDQPFFAVRDPRPLQDRGVYTLEEHAARLCAVIRSRQPEGPYIVGGHCYGGIVAFEVARQMERAGQSVGLLVLFEAPTPGYPKVVRHWRKYLRQAGAMALSNTGRQTKAQVQSHLGVWKELLRRKAQALTRRTLVSAGMQRVVAPIEKIELRNQRAARAYQPGKLNCNVVHFLAADESHDTLILDDPRLGWREKASAFSTCGVPGIADGIFKPPHVNELALQLRARLDHLNARAR